MKALRVLRVGADALLSLDESLPLPTLEPTSSHLLLRVLTCALNPGDVKFLHGALRPSAVPFTPGLEVCGIVEAVGSGVAATSSFRVGDRVVAALRPPQTATAMVTGGGLAQFVVVEAALAAVVPSSVSADEAVALPLAGTVALRAIKDAGVTAGSRVLILGASSDVGRMVVQLSKHAGAAFVAGTTPRKELVGTLSLDRAIIDDGQQPKWYDAVSGTEPFHVVIDCVGESNAWRHADKALMPRGLLVVLLGEMVSTGNVKATTQLLTLGFVSMWKSFWRVGPKLQVVGQFPSAETLRELLSLAEAHQLTGASTVVLFTPENVQQSLMRLADGLHTGKLIVQIPQEQ